MMAHNAHKNYVHDGITASITLLAVIFLLGLMRWSAVPDLDFRQPLEDEVIFVDRETSVGQQLPAEQCWQHTIRIPIKVVSDAPLEEGDWLKASLRTAAERGTTIGVVPEWTLSPAMDEITITLVPEDDTDLTQDCYVLLQSSAPENIVGIGVSRQNALDDASLFINGVQTDQDMVFDSTHRQTLAQMAKGGVNALVPTLQLMGGEPVPAPVGGWHMALFRAGKAPRQHRDDSCVVSGAGDCNADRGWHEPDAGAL